MTSQQESAAPPPPHAAAAPRASMPRLPVLDGWRGLSILAVLACHMLPLGPRRFELNSSAGALGMAIFFALSGFLITSTLFFHPSVRTFLIRRVFRIVPVAWLFLVLVLPFLHADAQMWHADLFFYTNLPPFHLVSITGHLWSLCVEVQFYLFIGVLFLIFRERGLAMLPLFCLAVTALRIRNDVPESIVTIYRVDDILSGASLAFLFHSHYSARLKQVLSRINPAIPLALLCLSTLAALPWLAYGRPYFAAIAIGTTLFHQNTRWSRFLTAKPLAYLAAISYALYVWHPLTTHGWFNSGSKLVKYSKRPLSIALSLLMAHLSTFYFEKFWINLAKRTTTPRLPSARLTVTSPAHTAPVPVAQRSVPL
jgi:peptidoglycan/LPS O-acetylase OafA/YrhL